MKKFKIDKFYLYYILLGIGAILILAGRSYITYKDWKETQYQQDIANEIIRFHIIANSDTSEDQELKLEVKEKVVSLLQDKLQSAENVDEARQIIQTQLNQIEHTATSEMSKRGYSYEANAYLTNATFPVKVYGDMVFPAGEYQALRVELGEGQGKNWWCVMFPTLCYVDGTYSVVPEESKKELKKVLTEDEYEALLIKNKGEVKIKFKLVDWIKKVVD